MSSSTSSSDRTPWEPLLGRKVWLGVLLFVAALEVFTRVSLHDRSKDFRRFAGYPARAEALVATGNARRIAFIGNSATDRGVDPRVVEATLARNGRPTAAALFVADQSRVDTWRYIFERYFARPERKPDLVVVTFYENDLEDGNPIEIGRLAQFFTSVRDWPELFQVNLRTLDERAAFVISSFSATYAARERIRERLLEALVPGFKEHTGRVNDIIFQHERRRALAAPAPATPPRFAALEHLLDRAAERGITLCFVAYPTLVAGGRTPYELRPELLALLARRGIRLIDLRHVPDLGPALYADEVHLTEAGRERYSAVVGDALAR
jgi:hypothetical protein